MQAGLLVVWEQVILLILPILTRLLPDLVLVPTDLSGLSQTVYVHLQPMKLL